MRYLSNGDFGFPFTWPLFQAKQFYIWSYQSGAVNADGVMRMPGRLFDLFIFVLFGNLAFEYFFIATSLIIAFLSFYYFSYKFLNVQSITTRLLASLFFTLNPIFLGNLSKIGLVMAAALLPLCLVAVREIFEQRRFRYILLWLGLLNISLIHPFTFAANFAISGSYLAYQAWLHKKFTIKNWYKFFIAAGAFIMLNSYILFPLASMHTVSKNVLSDTIASTPTDYTALVGVLNTGDIFTGLSLSKNVVKDYDFYSGAYASVYFLGSFALYALLIILYLRVEKRVDAQDKVRVAVLFGSFLILIVLATVTFLHVDALIKLLINTPGGWAFRSPLKWQLYIPLTLFGLFAVFMKYVPTRRQRTLVYVSLGIVFACMNGYLVKDIYRKLLTPRTVTTFNSLQAANLDHKSILIVNASDCWQYEEDHPKVMNELNQVLSSQNIQIKRVGSSDADLVDLGTFDYILGCQGDAKSLLTSEYNFKLASTFASNAFQLYSNQAPQGYVSSVSSIFGLTNADDLGGKYNFTTRQLQSNFNFALDPVSTSLPANHLQQAYDTVSTSNIRGNSMVTSLAVAQAGLQKLYVHENNQQLFYEMSDGGLSIQTTKQLGYQPVPAGNAYIPITVPNTKQLQMSYTDPKYTYLNLISNPSFENGAWQSKVGDCYNYDDQPEIGMSLDTKNKTDGKQSLELWSGNHVACSGPASIPVTPGQHYLLNFDYWGLHGTAGYAVSFDDSNGTVVGGRLRTSDNSWHTFTKDITVPSGAHNLRLRVEAYPDSSSEDKGIARFDNFKLMAVPDVQEHFYLVDQTSTNLQKPEQITYKAINPTSTDIHVTGASAPFYLQVGDTYSPQWGLAVRSGSKKYVIPAADHLKLNASNNGWYLDPAVLCANTPGVCRHNADGSYDMELSMNFAPQRWLYVGSLVSAVSFILGAAYFIYDLRYDRRRGVRYRLWE